MCATCDGRIPDGFLADVVGDIDRVGWAVIAVEDERGGHVYAYTVGLTRCHGHPELVVSGGGLHTAHHVLDELAARVCAGRRLEAWQMLGRREVGRRCLVIPVADPVRLGLAQAVYGAPGAPPVPALQVVWADEHDRWPWELPPSHRGGQEVYTEPSRTGEGE